MAPDRPDTSTDIEAAVGLASNQGVFGYCESFAFKEGDHATEFIETSVSSETIAEVSSEIKEDKEVKDEPSDDDLTSLSWLHQQNVLKTLEIPNTNKNSKDENVINNNFNEDSLDLSDENTNSVSDYDDTYSSVIDDKIANFSSAFQDVNGSHLINYASVIQENNFQSYTLSPNKQGKISTVNNNIINNNNNVSSVQRNKHPTHIPYDPQLHKNSKPPYSFSCLIFMAIEDSPVKALPVKEVYAWILQHFPYFRNAPTGWKNSVRHNLSLNKCFRKVEKSPNLGKGSLWMVDTQYRPNLMQALSRAPFPPPVIQTISPENTTRKTNTRLPDPVLFPYLSKRLASSNICENLDADFDSDVDAAAAAMLSFKHGPSIINNNNNKERKRKSQDSEKLVPIITRSCTEDHTYSLVTSVRLESKRCPNIENDSTDFDEQRKIAEGADALLNLAGVNTMHKELDPLDIPIKRKPKCNFENTPDKRRNRWREWNDNLRYIKQLRG